VQNTREPRYGVGAQPPDTVFALYVATFASYNKTYGALGGVIVFLVWLWVSNISILLGAEFDAELARERSIQAGQPADKEPYPSAPQLTRHCSAAFRTPRLH
jgi:uncharacterized BrkB/YihY/UPF0761 family membrane protein